MNGGRMQISQLVNESGVPRYSIHYYIRKGLLHPPAKTAKTRAYFDESHLERLLLIKKIKQKFHSPLDLIKTQIAENKRLRNSEIAFPLGKEESSGNRKKSAGFSEKKQKIIDAAMELFSSKGYYRTNVTDIANTLHISTGTFYIYFNSKDDLFIHVVSNVVRNTIAGVEKVIKKEKDFFKRNILRAEAFNENFTNFSAILTQLRAEAIGQKKWGENNVKNIYSDFTKPIILEAHKAINQGLIRKVNPDLLAFCLIGMCEMLLFRKTLDTQYNMDNIIAFMLDVIMNGLKPGLACT